MTATLLINPPYKRAEWADLKLKDFPKDQRWAKYMYEYGRAVTLAKKDRLTDLMDLAFVDKDKIADCDDIRKLVDYATKLQTNLATLEDRLIILMYAEWVKDNKDNRVGFREGKEYEIPTDDLIPWDEAVSKKIYELGCAVSIQLIHEADQFYTGIKV